MTRSRAMLPVLVLVVAACSAAPTPTAPPVGSPTASPSPGPGCVVAEQTGNLRSNTLIDLEVSSDGISDKVSFLLGGIEPGPTGSSGRLKAARPPFVEGGSGLPVEVLGEHFVELHFEGMLIADDTGTEMFTGPRTTKPDMLALQHVEMTEAFEGVYNFVIGYRGGGCVALVEDAAAKTITVTIGH